MDGRITGVREVIRALDRLSMEAEVTGHRIVSRGQAVVNANAKRQFTGAHSAKEPTTSQPGSPPDVVTGTLRRSVYSDKPAVGMGGVVGHVFPTAIYGRIQELGGNTPRGYLPPRPYMGPAYQESIGELERIAIEEWSKMAVHP